MTEFNRSEGVVVPPKSKTAIAAIGSALRKAIGTESVPRFPIVEIYDWLDWIVPGARYEVVESHLLGDDDARTYPDKGLILIREQVYDAAANGEGRARFTLAHELGHLMMHRNISFARVNPLSPPKIYANSEWQADVFASHLLIPANLLSAYKNSEDVVRDFCVSWAAADLRLRTDRKSVV